jgi:hypothetical protein
LRREEAAHKEASLGVIDVLERKERGNARAVGVSGLAVLEKVELGGGLGFGRGVGQGGVPIKARPAGVSRARREEKLAEGLTWRSKDLLRDEGDMSVSFEGVTERYARPDLLWRKLLLAGGWIDSLPFPFRLAEVDSGAVGDVSAWSITSSWMIGGGSIGRRSTERREAVGLTRLDKGGAKESCTFLPNPTHPSLARLLTKVELVLSGRSRCRCIRTKGSVWGGGEE